MRDLWKICLGPERFRHVLHTLWTRCWATYNRAPCSVSALPLNYHNLIHITTNYEYTLQNTRRIAGPVGQSKGPWIFFHLPGPRHLSSPPNVLTRPYL